MILFSLVKILSSWIQWGRGGALAQIHRWHCAMYPAMLEVIPGQNNRFWHDATVRSWPRWSMSSCRSLHTTVHTGHSSCQHSSPAWFTFLRYMTSSCTMSLDHSFRKRRTPALTCNRSSFAGFFSSLDQANHLIQDRIFQLLLTPFYVQWHCV